MNRIHQINSFTNFLYSTNLRIFQESEFVYLFYHQLLSIKVEGGGRVNTIVCNTGEGIMKKKCTFYVHMNSEVTEQLRWRYLNSIISRVNSSHRWRGQQQSTAAADVGVMITAAERVWPGQATGSLILYQIIPVFY